MQWARPGGGLLDHPTVGTEIGLTRLDHAAAYRAPHGLASVRVVRWHGSTITVLRCVPGMCDSVLIVSSPADKVAWERVQNH
jgi:hypothetical protein